MFTRWLIIPAMLTAVIVFLLPGTTSSALAHPADMYLQVQTVTLGSGGARLDWSISPGPMLSFVVWDQADQNGDGDVSPDEARAWAEPLLAEYYAILDQQTRLTWTLDAVEWPGSVVDFELGSETILIHVAITWPPGAARRQLTLYNHFEEANSIHWFYLNGADGVGFATPEQQKGLLQVAFVLPGDPAPPDDLRNYWDSGQPSLAMGGEPVAPPKPQGSAGSAARLTRLLRERDMTANFYLTAFAIALGLGALHALTPGHGKALVGAYLVGARGTLRHAVALGSIVTLTHTGSVLALGALTLAASHILMPTTVFPILEITSGLLIVGMGAGLMYHRWRAWQSVRAARRRWSAAPPEPAQAAPGAIRITINQPIRVNVYNDVMPATANGAPLGGIKWSSLVALGISGGLVPCPDAIAILLVAVAINQITLGLSMIVAFSLGMALVLTGIGIAMVRSQRMLGRLGAFDRLVPAMPLASALIVTGLGLGLMYQAITQPGFLNQTASPTDKLDFTVGTETDSTAPGDTFRVEEASFIFMDTDDANHYQLYRALVGSGDPVPLTDAPYGVWDYRLSPDGATIVYSAPQQYSGSDIWAIDTSGGSRRHLLDCPEAVCSRPVWSPDGTRLVHEKLQLDPKLSPSGVTSLWWLDVVTGDSGPVFQDAQLPGISPVWSPDGAWISYVSPGTSRVQLYNLLNGESRSVPSQTGSAAIWRPDSGALLITDIWSGSGDNQQVYTHLMHFDLATDTITDLTGDKKAGDTRTAWSPDGTWIAVVRREYSGPGASPGDQLWLMRADGSGARPLTSDADAIHGLPVWSPDGQHLLYQRYPLAGSNAEPGIWLLTVATQETRQVAARGNWPTWLP